MNIPTEAKNEILLGEGMKSFIKNLSEKHPGLTVEFSLSNKVRGSHVALSMRDLEGNQWAGISSLTFTNSKGDIIFRVQNFVNYPKDNVNKNENNETT